MTQMTGLKRSITRMEFERELGRETLSVMDTIALLIFASQTLLGTVPTFKGSGNPDLDFRAAKRRADPILKACRETAGALQTTLFLKVKVRGPRLAAAREKFLPELEKVLLDARWLEKQAREHSSNDVIEKTVVPALESVIAAWKGGEITHVA